MSIIRTIVRPLSILMSPLALIAALAPGDAAAQTCTPAIQAVTGVDVDYVRDGGGNPVMLTGSTERREHARISTTLADDLGILDTATQTIEPQQIRVIVDTEGGNDLLLASGLRATGNFTAVEAFSDPARVIEIYAENRDPNEPDEPDEDSGYYKLFEDDDAVDLTLVSVSVLPLAPSATTTVDNQADPPSTTTVQHFCEPDENGSDGFVETVTLDADKDFVLVVPHGGEIEAGTSEQVDLLTGVLAADYQVGANVWETDGFWDPAKLGSEHFHITSKALEEASFPGLDTLTSQAPFATGQPFRFAASLHGFGKYEGNGLVFGGHAHPETKCYVARAIQQRLSDLGMGKIAYYVYDDDGNVMVNTADERGKTIPEERGTPVGLTGRSSSNIVNRLAPNPDGADTDFGGMQIEESVPLRQDPVVRDLVARQIGHAFGRLIDDLTLVDPASTTWCDALEAGPVAPAGEVAGRVWLDDNEDGIQDGGENGVSGVTVSLLVEGAVVDTTLTDSAGLYAFTGLTEAEYAIRVTAPPAHGFGPEGAGNDEAKDSDVSQGIGQSDAELVTADGLGDLTLDAALVEGGATVACFDVTPVAFGSTWLASDVYDPNWLDDDFPATGWQEVQATVGYGDDVVTVFDPADLTVYMLLTFEVDDPSLYDSLDLTLFRDDGAAVYLNGTEVLRSNLPAGALAADTPALSNNEATVTAVVDAGLLEPGDNVLAVEVHNRSSTSSDLLVDVELSSRVCRPCLGAATIPVDFATYIEYQDTSANGGSDEVKIEDDNDKRSGLIRFDLGGAVPAGAEVLHAQLDLFVTDGSDDPYRFYPLLRAWNEAQATWADASSSDDWEIDGAKGVTDRDDRSVAAIVAFDFDNVVAEVVLNVEGRALIEEWAAAPAANHGLIIPGDEGSADDLAFASDDENDVGKRPVFKVVYATGCGG